MKPSSSTWMNHPFDNPTNMRITSIMKYKHSSTSIKPPKITYSTTWMNHPFDNIPRYIYFTSIMKCPLIHMDESLLK